MGQKAFGRTWNIRLAWGENVQLASSNWSLAPIARKRGGKRPRSKSKADSVDSDVSESDCGGESEGEEAASRAAAAKPTKRDPAADWVEA